MHESLEITEVTSTRGVVENVSICYLERKSAKTLGQINQLINEHYRQVFGWTKHYIAVNIHRRSWLSMRTNFVPGRYYENQRRVHDEE